MSSGTSSETIVFIRTVAAIARPFSGHSIPSVAVPHADAHDAAADTENITIENCPPGFLFVNEPMVYDSLEWTLTSPPPIHQFEEPPVNSLFLF